VEDLALTQKHIAIGGKMVPFAGYNMPVQYAGINEEHLTVRSGVGVFDVSHMGEFIIQGEKALDLLQRVTSNDVSVLVKGKIQYSYLPNDIGGIVDDLLVYMLEEDKYMLVVNASNIKKDWDWISSHNTVGAEMIDISNQTTLLAVQGPKAVDTLRKLTEIDLHAIKYYTFEKAKLNGIDDILISATGYTGAGGFEVYFENQHAEKIWDAIFAAGEEFGIQPIGLAARDTLRLEMGYCLYGNDITDHSSPLAAGLGWVTKFTKDFINSESLKKQKEDGVPSKLVGFEMLDRGIPRHDYQIVDAENNEIGTVTSGTMSPSLKNGIGMGYVKTEFSKAGTEIFILIRNKPVKAAIVKMPFYHPTD